MEKAKKCATIWGMVVLVVSATAVLVFVMPMQAVAKETNSLTIGTIQTQSAQKAKTPYSDVNGKTVDKVGIEAVRYVKAHKGYKGIISGKKFYPNKTFTRAQFLKILVNFYGSSKVPITFSDVKNAGGIVTGKYAAAKLVAVGKKLGVRIKWKNVSSAKLTRAGVSNYVKVFAQFNKAFRPRF